MSDITVVIPTIPPREHLLRRALDSVAAQTLPAAQIVVVTDHHRLGAPANRQRGLDQVETDWVAFLDDDDEFKPHHLQACMQAALDEEADMVFPWFEVYGGLDPFPHYFGKPWDKAVPTHTTVTTLVRTAVAREAGGFVCPETADLSGKQFADEDWLFTLRVNEVGKIYHLAEKTWIWHHDSGNTSGLPHRW